MQTHIHIRVYVCLIPFLQNDSQPMLSVTHSACNTLPFSTDRLPLSLCLHIRGSQSDVWQTLKIKELCLWGPHRPGTRSELGRLRFSDTSSGRKHRSWRCFYLILGGTSGLEAPPLPPPQARPLWGCSLWEEVRVGQRQVTQGPAGLGHGTLEALFREAWLRAAAAPCGCGGPLHLTSGDNVNSLGKNSRSPF